MTPRSKTLTKVIGGVIALAAAIVTYVYFFQPWRTCPYDDSSAACSMLPADAAVMATAMLGVLVGLVILGVGLFTKGVDVAR
ncbi:hypothetical protein [Mycetocola sp.]|uniref:hypothetical protein n=1 Tax=Mycetocola sp. TaxID=1871042 RepID=UPI003989D260